jgi:hypothetical protein
MIDVLLGGLEKDRVHVCEQSYESYTDTLFFNLYSLRNILGFSLPLFRSCP